MEESMDETLDDTQDWDLEERDRYMQIEHDEPVTEILVEADA